MAIAYALLYLRHEWFYEAFRVFKVLCIFCCTRVTLSPKNPQVHRRRGLSPARSGSSAACSATKESDRMHLQAHRRSQKEDSTVSNHQEPSPAPHTSSGGPLWSPVENQCRYYCWCVAQSLWKVCVVSLLNGSIPSQPRCPSLALSLSRSIHATPPNVAATRPFS